MNRLLRTIGGCGLAVVIIIALVMGLFVSNSTDDSSVPDATPPVGGKEVATRGAICGGIHSRVWAL